MDSQVIIGKLRSFRYFDLSTSDPILPVLGQKFFFITLLFFLIVLFVRADTQISTDDFECNAFNCGTGWNGAWSYTGSCEITTLATPLDTYHMRGQSACDATRNFDDSIYSEVNITFYATATSLEAGEFCRYYYYDGTTYHELLALTNGDDDGSHDYYNFNVTGYGVSSNAGIRMYGGLASADYCYLDNVTIVGVVGVDLNLYTDDQYLTGTQDVIIQADSSLTNTLHTFELAYSNGTIFCEGNVTSPAVPSTSFSTTCDMPNTEHYNATVTLYPTSQPEFNTTNYFDILQAQQDPSVLNIQRVYFSPQVLQGGSTEIFTVITLGTNVTIDRIITTLTFPDGTNRVLGMEPTINTGEYRAFITDTFQINTTYFTIRVESGVYYDTYTNQYEVAAYTVDFVETVLRVDRILSQPPDLDVAGTDYVPGEYGKIFLQLSDQGEPINNATCRLSVYYPNITLWVEDQAMIPAANGLQYYPFVAPAINGVYMVTADCEYFMSSQWYYDFDDADFPTRAVNLGTFTGSERNLNDYTDNLYEKGDAEKVGAQTYFVEANYTFNHSDVSNIQDMVVYYLGESSHDAILDFFWYNWTNQSWVQLANSLQFTQTLSPPSIDLFSPTGLDQFITNDLPNASLNDDNRTIMIKLRATNQIRDFALYSNWLNIKGAELTGEVANYLRGGGEVHIYGADHDLLENTFNLVFSYDLDVQGTDYAPGDNGRIFTSLSRNGTYINTASCWLWVHTPDSSQNNTDYFIEKVHMLPIGYDGLYYYDFIVPDELGIHMITSKCDVDASLTYGTFVYDDLVNATLISGSSSDITASDDTRYVLEEFDHGGNVKTYQHDFYFDLSAIQYYNDTDSDLVIDIEGYNYEPAKKDDIDVMVYNWTSGTWITLTNQFLAQTAKTDVLTSNNIDSNPDYFNSSGIVIVRLEDIIKSSEGGGSKTNEIGLDHFQVGAWAIGAEPVEAKGGGELNVRNSTGEILAGIEDLSQQLINEIELSVMGTDYEVGDNGRVWLQLVRNNTGFNDAICIVDIHNPSSIQGNNQFFVEAGLLTSLNDDGLYYYDFIAPNETGVYMVSASCFVGQNTTLFEAEYDNLIEGTVIGGSINDIHAVDGSYYELREQVSGPGNRSYVHDFYFNLTDLPANATFSAVAFNGRLNPLNAETIKFQVYNWSNGQFVDFPNEILAQASSTGVEVANTGDGSHLDDYINATGYARLRLQDTLQTGDTSSNTLYIDRLFAGATHVVAQPVLGIQGGGELNIRDRWSYITGFITEILIAINETPTSELLVQLNTLSDLVEDIEGVTDEQAFLITDSINSIQNMDSSSDVDEIKAYVKNNLEQFIQLTKNVESPKKQNISMILIVTITIISILFLSNRTKIEEPKEEPFVLPNVRGKTIQTHAHKNMSISNQQEGGRN